MTGNNTIMTTAMKRFWVITGIIVLAVMSRMLPHPANFTPLAAIALFAGAYFLDRKWAFVVPVAALFAGDLLLQVRYWTGHAEFPGFYPDMVFVYGSLLAVSAIGLGLRGRVNPLRLGASALAGGLVFFLVTNFGVWLTYSMYPKNLMGLMECYVAGLPFYRNAVLGDLVYTAVIFGAFEAVLSLRPSWKRVQA